MNSQANQAIYEAIERVLGERLAYRLHRRMCVRRLRHAGCVFVHIPKAAGTSVATAVIGRRAGHYTADELKFVMGAEEFDSLFSFAVTRHPMDRLVSAYHYACNGGGTHGAMRYEPVYGSDLFRSFDSFVHEWLAKQKLSEVDYVFRPQSHFIYENDTCLVDYVGRVENMDDVEQRLSEGLKRSIRISKKNTGHASGKQAKDVENDTLRVVYELYKSDFDKLGYEMEF